MSDHPLLRKVLIAAVLLSDLSFTGIVFGFSSLEVVWQAEGVYSELCDSGDNLCPAQLNRLNLCFTIASSLAVLSSLPSGAFVDTYGPRATSVLSGFFMIFGSLLLAFADSRTFDAFIPGLSLVGIGGVAAFVASLPAAFLAPPAQRASVNTAINCLFDASAVVFLIFDELFSSARTNISRRSLFIGFAIYSAVVYALLIVLWTLSREDYERARGQQRRLSAELQTIELAPVVPAVSAAIADSTQPQPQPLLPTRRTDELQARSPWQQLAFGNSTVKLSAPNPDDAAPLAVLVSCGSFSPVTYLHLAIFETARNHVMFEHKQLQIVGGILSPVHNGYGKASLIEPEHRVQMVRSAALSSKLFNPFFRAAAIVGC